MCELAIYHILGLCGLNISSRNDGLATSTSGRLQIALMCQYESCSSHNISITTQLI